MEKANEVFLVDFFLFENMNNKIFFCFFCVKNEVFVLN